MQTPITFRCFLLACIVLTGFSGANAMTSADSLRWLVQQSRFGEALSMTSRLQQSGLATAETYYMQGLSLKNLYRYEPAIVAFNKSYGSDSLRTENLSELGACFKALNNYASALFYFEKALAKNPVSQVLKTDIAYLYMVQGKYPQALAHYKQLYATDSGNVFFQRKIAQCFDKMAVGDHVQYEDSAIAYYYKSLQPVDGDYETVHRLCVLWMKHMMPDSAMKMTAQYISKDSTNIKINQLDATLYMQKGLYAESNRRFLHCYNNGDSSPFTLKYLGITSFKLNLLQDTKKYLEKAYLADSTDYEIPNYLGVACATLSYRKQAIYYLNRAISLLTPDSSYLGNIYSNLGKAYDQNSVSCKQAQKALLEAFDLKPDDPDILYQIAAKYDFCLNNREKALQYYRKFASTYAPAKKAQANSNTNALITTYYAAVTSRIKELELSQRSGNDKTQKDLASKTKNQ